MLLNKLIVRLFDKNTTYALLPLNRCHLGLLAISYEISRIGR